MVSVLKPSRPLVQGRKFWDDGDGGTDGQSGVGMGKSWQYYGHLEVARHIV